EAQEHEPHAVAQHLAHRVAGDDADHPALRRPGSGECPLPVPAPAASSTTDSSERRRGVTEMRRYSLPRRCATRGSPRSAEGTSSRTRCPWVPCDTPAKRGGKRSGEGPWTTISAPSPSPESRSSSVPERATLPCARTHTRSQINSTSGRMWLENTTVVPRS